MRLFDVNLRQNFFDAPLVQESCRLASVVKLNQEELPRVAELLGLKAGNGADELASRLRCDYDLEAVVLTRGADGTRLMSATGASEARVPVFDREPGADSVGAGDACSAGLLVGLLLGWPPARTVELANTAGAYVASRRGATPTLPEAVKDLVLN